MAKKNLKARLKQFKMSISVAVIGTIIILVAVFLYLPYIKFRLIDVTEGDSWIEVTIQNIGLATAHNVEVYVGDGVGYGGDVQAGSIITLNISDTNRIYAGVEIIIKCIEIKQVFIYDLRRI